MTTSNLDLASQTALKEHDIGARRTRLREFQARLVERMHAASTGAQATASQLGVMIGQTRWLLKLQEAGEIVSVGTITKVPLTQDWFLGLTNIRGNLISVIDLAHFRGMPPTPIDKESRIIAFAPSLSFNSGLLVSRVMGLRNVTEMEPQSDSGTADTPWALQRYLDRESQVWTELDLSLIVQDPQFLHVGL
ncbi:chemotaxis protein CheW [Noviherbaspirillum sp.]|uniref:chemotaxis protein CheW n=1 Tax=Noviherbaspirillum sp. TaxID=1926288 RepID=UPI002B45B155|nr:chemotaxis protein CheW [Noviherbaspirillum sp.]HJV83634.1 chemotaxis protein CheW [Noviherbaspirillum sp.]